MSEQFITTAEAARRLKVTIKRVQAMINQGRLPATKFGQVWMIRVEDLKLVENRRPGRPPKKR